jgi:preprotein translocase subunit YajC
VFENLFAMGSQGGQDGGSFMGMILPFALIFLVVYFLMIRPQAKKQKDRQKMLDVIEKGDKVVTIGGVHGRIMGFKNDDKIVIIKVDENVKLDIDRTAISNVIK